MAAGQSSQEFAAQGNEYLGRSGMGGCGRRLSGRLIVRLCFLSQQAQIVQPGENTGKQRRSASHQEPDKQVWLTAYHTGEQEAVAPASHIKLHR